ncbi:hypothetical protein [Streptomyces sp. NPDC048200]|uniref:hypothetical protein n=1 Tax=Streptomyces sp. NPDC048200 TaxID=3365512 RepID=UPI00371A381C
MVNRTVRVAILSIVSVVAMTASACGSSPKPCAGVGVTSQIGVMFLERGYNDLEGASYKLCAGDRCVKGHVEQADITHLTLPLPDDVDPDVGTVRFRVTPRGSGSPEIDASSDVKLTRQSDGCGGGAYNRGLAFTKEGGLTTKIPPSVSTAWREHIKSLASPSESR